jgi:hypothetical protein
MLIESPSGEAKEVNCGERIGIYAKRTGCVLVSGGLGAR